MIKSYTYIIYNTVYNTAHSKRERDIYRERERTAHESTSQHDELKLFIPKATTVKPAGFLSTCLISFLV